MTNFRPFEILKLEISANDKFGVGNIEPQFSDRTENIVGKGENAVNQHLSLCTQCYGSSLSWTNFTDL